MDSKSSFSWTKKNYLKKLYQDYHFPFCNCRNFAKVNHFLVHRVAIEQAHFLCSWSWAIYSSDSCMRVTSLQTPLVISVSHSVPSHNNYILNMIRCFGSYSTEAIAFKYTATYSMAPLKRLIIELNIYI